MEAVPSLHKVIMKPALTDSYISHQQICLEQHQGTANVVVVCQEMEMIDERCVLSCPEDTTYWCLVGGGCPTISLGKQRIYHDRALGSIRLSKHQPKTS